MILKNLTALFVILPFLSISQDYPPVTADERKEAVDSIGSILDRNYIFPEIGKKIKNHLQSQLASGAYDKITDPMEFDHALTEAVRSINNDRHLDVGFNPDWIARRKNVVTKEDSLAMEKRGRREGQLRNYGFKEVKLLDGNIGYLNLTGFFGVDEESGRTAEAAMNLLANADALIIDLRQNGGGSPSMIQLITSYLVDDHPIHLNSFYNRPEDNTTQKWTLPYVPGKRRPDIDLYVLTSSRTFSAAEEFSYNLRNLERATLVGEVTGGGAHPGGTHIATERYTVWVPTGRAINPITKTNWEQVGVKPHITVPAEQALRVAQIQAMEKLMTKTKDEDDKSRYKWNLETLKAEQNPVELSKETLMSYVGTYGPRKLSFQDGQLLYQREGNASYRLIPMKEGLFRIEEIPEFRIKIVMENNKAVAVVGMYDNGHTDKNLRTQISP